MGGCGIQDRDCTCGPIALPEEELFEAAQQLCIDQLLEIEELFGVDFTTGKHWQIPFSTVPCCGRPILSGW